MVCSFSPSHTATTTDLDWRVLYVGSAESSDFDQVLEEVVVGPVPVGHHKFVLEADPPDVSLLQDTALGVTVVLITCSLSDNEFVRIGYYVHNELCVRDDDGTVRAVSLEEDELASVSPALLPWHRVNRTILANKPRVTRFTIPWRQRADAESAAEGESPNEQGEAEPAQAAVPLNEPQQPPNLHRQHNGLDVIDPHAVMDSPQRPRIKPDARMVTPPSHHTANKGMVEQ